MRNKNHLYYCSLVLWIFLIGSMGQLWAQSGFNPEPPPEPGFLSVKLTSNPEGCASFEQTNPQGIYASGAKVSVKVTPHKDYDFVGWTQNGKIISQDVEYMFTITSTVRLVALLQFNPKDNPLEPGIGYFNVITESDPSDGGWVEQNERGLYRTGETVILTVHPSSSYAFHHWEMGGKIVGKELQYQFTMPSEHVKVKAVYEWNPQSPVEPGTTEGGMGELIIQNSNASAGYISQSGSGIYPIGTQVTLKASPFTDYRFDGWYEDNTLLATTLSYSYTITKQKSVVQARFSYAPAPDGGNDNVDNGNDKNINIGVGNAESNTENSDESLGSVQVDGIVKPGQEIELEAKPNDGFAFEGWYVDGKFVEDAEMNFTYLVEQGVKSIIAKFAELPFILEQEGVKQEGKDPWAYVSRLRNNIATLKAKKVEGYSFLGWFKGKTLLSKLLEYAYNVTSLRASLPTITAKYAEGAVGIESIISSDQVNAFVEDGNLYFTTLIPVDHLRIYRFDGNLIHEVKHVEPAAKYVIPVPKVPLLIQVITADKQAITLKRR